jgi:hypothetical protein
MVLFALFVSIVFATMMRDEVGAQVRLGLRLLAAFVGAGIVIGWLLYPLPL